jgi:hypothetical protein
MTLWQWSSSILAACTILKAQVQLMKSEPGSQLGLPSVLWGAFLLPHKPRRRKKLWPNFTNTLSPGFWSLDQIPRWLWASYLSSLFTLYYLNL